jgi:hypothetical protein
MPTPKSKLWFGFIPPSPLALAVNGHLAGPLFAREISRSPEVSCDGPAPVEASERSLEASSRFHLALAVSLISFLHLQPEFD